MPDGRRLLTREHGLLAMMLAIALLHALFEARVRPLYQVPDEMAYLRAAQMTALEAAPDALRACIAPPGGDVLETGEGGKRGFRVLTGLQLRVLCQVSAEGHLPLFALRAWQALSLPLIAWAAWYLGRLLSGRAEAGLLAAMLVAAHPVAAVFAGGVTPDAWANAFSAGAFVAATRLALSRDRWWDSWLLVACIVGGLLWKDTTYALVLLVPSSLAVRAARRWQGSDQQGRPREVAILASLVVFAGVAALLTSALWTPYVGPDRTLLHVTAAPFAAAQRVVADATLHAPGVLASSLLSLYRPLIYLYPDPHQPLTPALASLVFVAIAIAAVGGAILQVARGRAATGRVVWQAAVVWAPAAVLCVLQPSIRQVVVNVEELHQGRWMFPLLAPAAALMATWAWTAAGSLRILPLLVVGLLASLWMVVLDVVRHYYVAMPDRLNNSVLFLRPTGDHDIGDLQVRHLVEATTTAQDPATIWGILVLLGVASLWLAMSAIRHASPPAPHV